MTTIIVTHEDNEVDEFEFEPDHNTISIGRRSSNDVCVPDLSISGNHARIVIAGSEAWLEDLDSTNGSYVNGQVIKRVVINNGDDIILGKIRMAFIHTPVAEATTNAAQTMDALAHEPESTPVMEAAGDGFDDSFAEASQAHDSAAENAEPATEKPPSQAVDDDEMSFDEDARIFAQPPVESARTKASHAPAATASLADSAVAAARAAPTHNDNQESQHPLEGVERHVPPVSATDPEPYDSPPMHQLDNTPATSKGAVIEIKNGAKSGQILPIDKPVTTLGRPGIQIAAIMRKPDGYFLMHIESDDSVDRPTLNQDAIGDEPVLLHSGDELNVAGIDVEFMLS